MKILFLSSRYPPNARGGGEVSTHLIAQGLRRRGHEVVVVTAGAKREERVVNGVPVLALPVALTTKPLLERRQARQLARRMAGPIRKLIGASDQRSSGQEWVVHAHDLRTIQVLSELVADGTLSSAKAVVTSRDYAQICGSPNNLLADGRQCAGCNSLGQVIKNQAVVEAPFWRKPFRVWQYRYNIGYRLKSWARFKYQIFISEAQRDEIAKRQRLVQTDTRVIYNPVPDSYWQRPPTKSIAPNLLYVGRVAPYKGVGLLLTAFRDLAKELPNIQLVIVGEGDGRDEYEKLVDSWGLQYRVKFTSQIAWERMRRIYDEARVVVAPHVWLEPFGRTVVEAMARERLVVAADVGGPAEIIESGKTGLLFKHGSVQALTDKLREGLTMGELQRSEIGRAARRWTKQHLSQDLIAQQYEEVYQDLVSSE